MSWLTSFKTRNVYRHGVIGTICSITTVSALSINRSIPLISKETWNPNSRLNKSCFLFGVITDLISTVVLFVILGARADHHSKWSLIIIQIAWNLWADLFTIPFPGHQVTRWSRTRSRTGSATYVGLEVCLRANHHHKRNYCLNQRHSHFPISNYYTTTFSNALKIMQKSKVCFKIFFFFNYFVIH